MCADDEEYFQNVENKLQTMCEKNIFSSLLHDAVD